MPSHCTFCGKLTPERVSVNSICVCDDCGKSFTSLLKTQHDFVPQTHNNAQLASDSTNIPRSVDQQNATHSPQRRDVGQYTNFQSVGAPRTQDKIVNDGRSVTIGSGVHSRESITIGDVERRSGLYVLGKPGMGKSTILVNLILQDAPRGHSVFLLDPHGEAIRDVIRSPQVAEYIRQFARLIDPSDEKYTIGINPLECREPERLSARQRSLDKTLDVFRRLWGQENLWGVYLERILQSALPIFIELQEYTLAELPLFLTNNAFRRYILEKVKYNTHLLDFWQYECRPEQAQSALNRIGILLSNPYVRDIVGQTETHLDFAGYAKHGYVVFLHLPGTIDLEARRFIGTIVLSELFHALYNRPEDEKKNTFYLYVDEFQQFATEQFADFILEGRKFGVATTIAHQERGGQFGENRKILGATLACANKIVFQSTVTDARELAPEFAEKPVALETRLVPEMVICKEPMWDLLRRGHANPRIMELFRKYPLQDFEGLSNKKAEAETLQLQRSGHFDDALLYRDHASLSGVDERRENRAASLARGRDINISNVALDQTELLLQQAINAHQHANDILIDMKDALLNIQRCRRKIDRLDKLLVALMEGILLPERGNELFATLVKRLACGFWHHPLNMLPQWYIDLALGDPKEPRTIPCNFQNVPHSFLITYYPKQAEAVYMKYWEPLNVNKDPDGNPRTPEGKKEVMELNLEDFYAGQSHGGTEIRVPNVPRGILSERELAYAINACRETITGHYKATEFDDGVDECIEFCQLLARPENHILLPSGQYVEKPVQIASTQEMINQATQTLSGLPQYTAYAKILDGDEVWKGQIKTKPVPKKTADNADIMEQIEQITREKCYRLRSEVASEIADRRARWRATSGGTDEPPPSRARN